MFDGASKLLQAIKTVLQLKTSTPCTFFLVNFNYVSYFCCSAYSRIRHLSEFLLLVYSSFEAVLLPFQFLKEMM